MIILDTNVLSEAVRPAPAPEVLIWLASRPRASLFTTAIARAEMLYGVRLLPEGRRRHDLEIAALGLFDEDFAGQVLGFDEAAADAYADISAVRRLAGRPISTLDAMIAAIARSRGASLATRNVSDFERCDVNIIDPWAYAP